MKSKYKRKSFLINILKNRAEKIERNKRKSIGKSGKKAWHYSLSQIKKDFSGYQHVWAPPYFSLVENEKQVHNAWNTLKSLNPFAKTQVDIIQNKR